MATIAAGTVPELLRVLDAAPGTDVLDELAARWGGAASYDVERRLREAGLATVFLL